MPMEATRSVEITFDCMPLRSVGRLDVPLDASPKFRERCERILKAIRAHGTHNTYYLYNATCRFRLTNGELGMIEFRFEGTVMTDETDRFAIRTDLDVELVRETCDWLTEPIVAWLKTTAGRAVQVEFDRYIAVGDLDRTLERLQRLQAQTDQQGGYLGMFL